MTLPFVELTGDIRVPTVAAETNLTSGVSSLPQLRKKLLLVGYSLAAKSANDEKIFPITSGAFADETWGAGSMLALMARAALAVQPTLEMWGVSAPEGSTAMTGTVTVAGGDTSKAVASGTLIVTIAGRRFKVGITVGDSLTEIAAAMVVEINNETSLPCTADNAAGVITLTANNEGPEQTIRYRAEIVGTGTEDPITVATAADLFSGSATEGDIEDALVVAEGDRYHIIVSGCNDADNIALLCDGSTGHVDRMSTGLEQKWCYGIVGVDSDVSAATSQATTTDAYRLQIACQVAAERPSYEIAAIFGALRARYVDPAESLDWVEMTGLQATYDASQWINRADEELALSGGVTILRSLRTGKVEIVRSVNTKVTSVASGYYDHNPIEISDYMDESLVAAFRRKAAGKKLKSLSVAGTPNTITTTKAKQILHEVMRTLDRLDYIEGVESDIAAGLTAAEINATDRNRLDIGCPFRPIGRAHVIAILKTLTVNAL